MSEYKLKTGKTGEAVTNAFKKIEDRVVGSYKRIEDGAVSAYKGVEKKFVDAFPEKADEPENNAGEEKNA